jgi:hypothetical protein
MELDMKFELLKAEHDNEAFGGFDIIRVESHQGSIAALQQEKPRR